MTVAAAIRITSPDDARVVGAAESFARHRGEPLLVISIVRKLPYGATNGQEEDAVAANLRLIAAANASPLMQEGDDIPGALLIVASTFGVGTLFLQAGSHPRDRSVAERLLVLQPPFDVVVLPAD